jgi:hypothetical protein
MIGAKAVGGEVGAGAVPAETRVAAASPAAMLLVLFVLGAAVLADRAVVVLASGGRGLLPVLAIVAPIVAVLTVARFGSARSLRFMTHPIFVFGVLPYVALTGLLPILGVMINRYPERTLLSITDATTALSFLVIGAALSGDEDRAWTPWLVLAIGVQFGYALGQAIYLAHGPGWQLFAPLHQWDRSVGALVGQFVEARSRGLYVNPNELGLWAAAAAILAWTLLSDRLRGIGLTLALLTLLLSQSRGALVALAVALLVAGVVYAVRGRVASGSLARVVLWFGLAGVLVVGAAIVVAPTGALVERFGSLVRVLSEGPQADPNLAGRLDYWSAVTALNSVYPWGTLGSPELLLGTAIDSTWFRAFGQGSVIYVTSLIVLLVTSLFVGGSRFGQPLRLITLVVAVAGVTQNPFGYPIIVLYWALLGAALQASVVASQPDRRRRPASAQRALVGRR